MSLCLGGHACAQADVQSTHLRGAVVDSVGAAVAGGDVVVYREGTTVAHQRTDARGEFSFDGAPREYRVVVRAPGFLELRSGPVPFEVDSTSRFTLAVSHPGQVLVTNSNSMSPVLAASTNRTWEFGVLGQGGVGTSDRSGFKFFLLGGHAGKVLTPNLGSGLLQGNFEYAVEVFPFWQSYTPRFQRLSCLGAIPVGAGNGCSQPYTVGGTYTGVSITPIMLRWNLTHGERWMPWVQGAGGVVWTNHKYPAVGDLNPADIASNGPSGDTSVWNFTPQFGVGMHYFLKPGRSLDFSANAVHISSASLGDKNPGVNASVQFSVGYTWWK